MNLLYAMPVFRELPPGRENGCLWDAHFSPSLRLLFLQNRNCIVGREGAFVSRLEEACLSCREFSTPGQKIESLLFVLKSMLESDFTQTPRFTNPY